MNQPLQLRNCGKGDYFKMAVHSLPIEVALLVRINNQVFTQTKNIFFQGNLGRQSPNCLDKIFLILLYNWYFS